MNSKKQPQPRPNNASEKEPGNLWIHSSNIGLAYSNAVLIAATVMTHVAYAQENIFAFTLFLLVVALTPIEIRYHQRVIDEVRESGEHDVRLVRISTTLSKAIRWLIALGVIFVFLYGFEGQLSTSFGLLD